MGKVIMSGVVPQLAAPRITGIALSEFAEGSVVKITESGTPVEFYVAKHDYESTLNGTGRTLLVRKNVYDQRKWNDRYNTYADSLIDAWLNGDYKALLDSKTQSATATTTFYYTIGRGDTTITTLSRSVFLLSEYEFGITDGHAKNQEGSPLPIESILRTGYLNGESPDYQWTRTPQAGSSNDTANSHVAMINGDGPQWGGGYSYPASTATNWSRPCFTLPATALFDEKTLLFKGVS